MSIHCIDHVWRNSSHKGTALLLMLAVADYANDEGMAWPAIQSLARKIRMSERFTQELLRRLIDSGELRVVRPGGGRATTKLQVATKTGEAGLTGKSPRPVRRGAPRGEAGLTGKSPRPVRRGAPRGEAGLTQSVINRQSKQLSDLTSAAAAINLHDNPAAAAEQLGWDWGMINVSKTKLSELNASDTMPAAFVSHYLEAACKSRIKDPAAMAVRMTFDRPAGAGRPWSDLAAMSPQEMARVLAWLRDGGVSYGGVSDPAALALRGHTNGRHAEVAERALSDLGLWSMAEEQPAEEQPETDPNPEPEPKRPTGRWPEILAACPAARDVTAAARIVSDDGVAVELAVTPQTYRYLTPARLRSLFGRYYADIIITQEAEK